MRVPLHRFSSDRTGSVKYSTSCPCRTLSPCAASRAIPTSRGPESGSKGREAIAYSPFVRYGNTPTREGQEESRKWGTGLSNTQGSCWARLLCEASRGQLRALLDPYVAVSGPHLDGNPAAIDLPAKGIVL